MEKGNRAQRQAAAVLRMASGKPTAEQRKIIANRMDLFKQAADIASPESPDQFTARVGKQRELKEQLLNHQQIVELTKVTIAGTIQACTSH